MLRARDASGTFKSTSVIVFWLSETNRSNPFLPKPPKTGVPKIPVIPRWHPPEAQAGPPAQRSDQPSAKAYSTGSRDKALHIAASPELRQEAINVLNAQMWAKTARGPRQSRENLWNAIASTAGFHDPRDLTPQLLTTVTAILVQAGYRSTPAVVSQTVTSFKRKGRVWCDTLDLASRMPCERPAAASVLHNGLRHSHFILHTPSQDQQSHGIHMVQWDHAMQLSLVVGGSSGRLSCPHSN